MAGARADWLMLEYVQQKLNGLMYDGWCGMHSRLCLGSYYYVTILYALQEWAGTFIQRILTNAWVPENLCTEWGLDSLDTPATEKEQQPTTAARAARNNNILTIVRRQHKLGKHWRWHFATRNNNQPQPQIANNNKNTTWISSLTSAVLSPLPLTLPRNIRSPCRHRRLSGNSWISGTTGWHDHLLTTNLWAHPTLHLEPDVLDFVQKLHLAVATRFKATQNRKTTPGSMSPEEKTDSGCKVDAHSPKLDNL